MDTVGYDEKTRTLEVEFHGGRVYLYFDVPRAYYEELMSASSTGRYLNDYIKPAFRYARV